MISRPHFIKELEKGLSRQAAVGLIGPRQVGKTTLALALAKKRPSIYLDLELKSDRDKLSEPELFLKLHEDKLVILDEIHRMPELFQPLRGLIDQGRRKGKRTGRFLVLGSASIDLLRQSGETLAGRIEYIDLGPLSILEIKKNEKASNQLWLRGGFPDAYLSRSDADSFRLRRSFIRTYLERDVPQFGPRIPADILERLWIMLAHNQGTLLNASRLASGLSMSVPTVITYVSLLADLLLVRRLMPYHSNIGKRMVKSHKTYVRDSGLLHALLGIQDMTELSGHPVVGSSWEGFVIENLLSAAPERAQASFYRTAAGGEIDLILDLGGKNGLWAIEIKRSLTAKPERGFYHALEDLKPKKSFVVYAGEERYPINKNVEAISLRALAQELSLL
ncbi:MAG: ATP-binding protein [Chthoniobacterales bacterium]